MKRIAIVLMLILLVAGAFLAGRITGDKTSTDEASIAGRKILYYVDPMNPSHTTAEPGLAPCGMEMEPVYADEETASPNARSMPPGTVKLNLHKQQLIGLRTGVVEKKKVAHTLRLTGKVEADATRSYQVTAPAEGWVTKSMALTVGDPVHKDQTLSLLYSPTFISASQAFRNALDYQDRMLTNQLEGPLQRPGIAEFNVKQYADSLRNLGVSDRQINDMLHRRQYGEHIEVVAPAAGYLSLRSISEGQRFEKGEELYRIVDLSRVWIVADVFNRDALLIGTNIGAKVIVPSHNSPIFARLTAALPQFDVASRSLKLRFEAENPQLVLKPEMFVDVVFDVTLPESLVAPADAVLDSGLRQTVFIATGNGTFEPRVVETGWRLGDTVQITRGVMAGEKIVISGNFLLDSESRMKLAAAGNVVPPKAHPTQKVSTNSTVAAGSTTEIDLICGMKVNPEKARASGRFYEYGGNVYYFCAEGCKEEFKANPSQFLNQTASTQANHDQPHR